jgi:hypothetical protein
MGAAGERREKGALSSTQVTFLRSSDEMASCMTVFRRDGNALGEDTENGAQPDERRRSNHVLMLGSVEAGNVVRCALLGEPHLLISIVTNYRELWTIPAQERFDLVVLNVTLSKLELDASSRLIRQRWPGARILVVRQGEILLEDALYDDRVTVEESPELLRERIKRLLSSGYQKSS